MPLVHHYLLRRQELLNRWSWFRPFPLQRPFLGGDFVLSHSWMPGMIEVSAPLAQAVKQLAAGEATPDSGPEHEQVTKALRELGWLQDLPLDLDALVAKSQKIFLAVQNPVELRSFLELLYERRPKVIVEIGTASGGHLYCLSQVADPSGMLVSVDFPGGNYGRSQTNIECKLYSTFGPPGQRIEFIRQSSLLRGTLTMLKETLGGREIELLYLDGDHTYAGVKSDYVMYEPLVAKDGIIGFHDMLEIPKEASEWQRGNEVSIFWQELAPKVDSREIVDRTFPPAGWDGLSEARSSLWPPLGIGLVMGNRGTQAERPEETT
jgi:predicted O-methyltransferase YrrM